jgi:hypothetical protein
MERVSSPKSIPLNLIKLVVAAFGNVTSGIHLADFKSHIILSNGNWLRRIKWYFS